MSLNVTKFAKRLVLVQTCNFAKTDLKIQFFRVTFSAFLLSKTKLSASVY